MIIGEIRDRKIRAKLLPSEIFVIKAYIQGAVYCWCKNCKMDNQEPIWFSASDLFGGDNYDWNGTPLLGLYKWHEENEATCSSPAKLSAI